VVDSGEGVRWGIVGTGGIARAFAKDLALLPDAVVGAVGSRSAEGADSFAAFLEDATGSRIADAHRHASYDALVSDDGVDAVYVATPHPGHAEAARLALEAGKAVLVEKPFTLNAAQAQELVDLARSKSLFLMEAMWTRFLPHIARVREILAAGTLGEIVTVTADHGQWFEKNPEHRLFAPELGGGALLDLGIYPLSFASFVLGTPERVTARSIEAFTGVDANTSVILEYAGGAHALVNTTLSAATANVAAVNGTEARIEIDRTWYVPTTFRVTSRDGEVLERYDAPHEGHGLRHQAAEVGRCLAAGALESELLPLDETVAIMRTLDEVRSQIGLVYPQER
jgi:predicted dehydrogenase